jgi:GxxExxY protein
MLRRDPIHEELTRSVIGAFYDAYNTLGFGFLEHVYVLALERELRARGHRVGREVGVTITYKGDELAMQRLDMVVDEVLVVETKSTYELHPIASRQLFNYLRASGLHVGLLLHFGPKPKIHRVVCRHDEISVREERSD